MVLTLIIFHSSSTTYNNNISTVHKHNIFNKSYNDKIYLSTFTGMIATKFDGLWELMGYLGEAAVRLPDLNLKTLGERGIECIFVGYAEHCKAFRFSLVHRPRQRSLKDGTEDSGGSVVSERVTKEVVQQPKSKLRKSKRHRTPKDFGSEFQLYLIEGTRDEISDQHSYFFNVKDDPKTFDEVIRLARISTSRLVIAMASIHNLIIYQMDVKTSFLNGELEEEVDLTKEFLSSRFSMKDMREADVILGIRIKHESNVSTLLDTYEKLMPNKGPVVSQLKYTSNPGTQHWQAIQRVLKYLKKTLDYRLVSKKQTCIAGLTMESEFVALAATGKEAEWLKNLLLEIPLEDCLKFSLILGFSSYLVMGLEVQSVHPEVTEHRDSDSGLKGIHVADEVQRSLMKFSLRIPSVSNSLEEVSSAD
nr:hypothetical protein [Tanacetum cinerariifolium]